MVEGIKEEGGGPEDGTLNSILVTTDERVAVAASLKNVNIATVDGGGWMGCCAYVELSPAPTTLRSENEKIK